MTSGIKKISGVGLIPLRSEGVTLQKMALELSDKSDA